MGAMATALEADASLEVIERRPMGMRPAVAWHQPIMVASVLEHLRPRHGALIVDGTVGTGGHSLAILPSLPPDGRLIAVDRDRDALTLAEQRLAEFAPHARFLHGNYRHLPRLLSTLGITQVDGILLDLGMSSLQVDRAERGFSFSKEGPLDMRMDSEQDVRADTLVNRLPAAELASMLATLGEERYARRIAQRIVEARRRQVITTTGELARLIAAAVPASARHGRLHPATRAFQALRLAVNDELGSLAELLEHLAALLKPGGRAVVLTYQSLDDRLVKQAFVQGQRDGHWDVLTKKPLRPTAEEIAQNPRARSAKLRAVQRRADR